MEEILKIDYINEINTFNMVINNSKLLINKEIHKFLFCLLKKIFLKNDKDIINVQFDKYLNEWINKINNKIIKKKDKFINEEYSIDNFNNIFEFIKSQNKKYAGEILEGILIIIFSYGFKIEKDMTFGKYLYFNLPIFKKYENNDNYDNYDLIKWFQKEKFKPKELKNINNLFEIDEANIVEKKKESVLLNILYNIFKEKYFKSINKINYNNNKYEYKNSLFNNSTENIYEYNNLNKSFILSSSQMLNTSFNKYFIEVFSLDKKNNFQIIKFFFISVYIYYQNKNSPLMKYIQSDNIGNKNKLAIIPFEFNLCQACIEEQYAHLLFAPLRVEPRINKIILSCNNLKKLGLYELSKTLIFNKNIKIIDYSRTLLYQDYLGFINYGFGIFDNYSVEELDISENYLNENCEKQLAKILKHFKGLKTIQLSHNYLRRGMTSFFIILKKLYCKRKTKLENLYLNSSNLDERSYYELGELLKCKSCKLKLLCIDNNIIQINNNFLNKLKKNKSIKELYLDRNNISNSDTYYISKIINFTNIKHLYFHKNNISNFNDFLRILYRTKIIKDKNSKNIIKNEGTSLINLDMSDSQYFSINTKNIILLIKIIQKTTLSCLDISHILFGRDPDKYQKNQENINYIKTVEILKQIIINNKDKYDKINKQININTSYFKKYKDDENEEIFEFLNEKIISIISNKNSLFPLFLKENAKNIIKDEKNKYYIIAKIYKKKQEYNITLNKIEQKLVNYMMYKRTEKNLIQLKEELKEKKLILI